MRCDKCGQDFPSVYYFKTDTICLDCFQKMSPEDQQAAVYKQLMKHPMTTTTFTIEGHKILKQLGVVRGITVAPVQYLGQSERGFKRFLVAIFLCLQNYVRNPVQKHLIWWLNMQNKSALMQSWGSDMILQN